MSYQTILVHVQLGHSNAGVLHAAKQIAQRCNAAVIGVAVGQQTLMIYGQGYQLVDFFDREQTTLEEKINTEKALFEAAFNDHTKPVDWLSVITMEPAVDYLVAHASSVDLIITGATAGDFYEGPNYANACGIVMQSGRPVLAVPVNAPVFNPEEFKLNTMLVGWKESREARRAIADAIPLLQLATQVIVLEMVAKDHQEGAAKRLNSVVIWLQSHGIAAQAVVTVAADTDAAQFIAIAKQYNADIVITGAYGHSRFREWVLGGITNELLQNAHFNSFLSH
ncbi:MAG: universal stress protein [Bdellovibrio sp.]|nr:universal stress protein [Methylotenera sp.]